MLFSVPTLAREFIISSKTDDLTHVLMILRLEKILSTPATETSMVKKIIFKNIIQDTGLQRLIYSLNFKYLVAQNVYASSENLNAN
jgi:hypothetical protein